MPFDDDRTSFLSVVLDDRVSVETRILKRAGFIGGSAEIAVLAFLLGTVGSSFLSEVGKDLWTKCKELCTKVLAGRDTAKATSKILLVFDYRGVQIALYLELGSKEVEALSASGSCHRLTRLWSELDEEIAALILRVARERDSEDDPWALVHHLGREGWTSMRRRERIDVSRFLQNGSIDTGL